MARLLCNRLRGCRGLPVTGLMSFTHKVMSAGLRTFEIPPDYSGVGTKDRQKLKFVNKVPDLVKVKKEPKNLQDIRGPALEGREFQEGQYGIVALGGGYLHWGHFEMMRLTLNRTLSPRTTFSRWLVAPPYKPVTRKGLGQRMGGGKGAVDHYVTPVKADQLILEVGGRCEFEEVKPILSQVAKKLPFPAQAVSRESLRETRENLKEREINNRNPWTFERLASCNMLGCRKWLSPYDLQFKGRFWGKRHLPNRV
ncbi:39S ribosomal protein L16, mitochondrial [Spea bombifrons]|uniref:39S ribosomal protein L16, mitochondrial n=1 Tax=Spea bombifrons TaxID=233779 RepID=UPI00234AD6B3|nr:39S ribosomal protein L16, mitochondrial [Spea bombifrons]